MQTERLMTNDDLLALANQLAQIITKPVLNELKEVVKQEIKDIKDANAKKDDEFRILLNAQAVAEELEIPLKRARKFIAMSNFPKSIGEKRKLYKTGPWLAIDVKRFFRINKNKV